jgi:serine/threonine-protein kinase
VTSLAPGTRLGPYEIVAPLGAGGMGEVYRAKDTRLGREVAIKMLPAEVASDAERLRRFEQEAKAVSALNHPHIVTLYEVGQSEHGPYLVLEKIEGHSLRELLRAGALPVKRVLALGAQIAEGLAKAHGAGIVHRDLKPDNVMVTADGFAKILDFGLAELVWPELEGSAIGEATTLAEKTGSGFIVGTLDYLSPEQAVGKPADFRSEQFALGALLYEMSTGERPFRRETVPESLAAVIREEPEPLRTRNAALPAQLGWTVERCLSKDPNERYGSTRDLARDLADLRDHLSEIRRAEPLPIGAGVAATPQRRRERVAWSAAAALALLAVSALLRSPAPEAPPPVVRFTVEMPAGALLPVGSGSPVFALSPAGRSIVFVGASQREDRRALFVRPFDAEAPHEIPDTSEAQSPFFSPDGSSLGFFQGEMLRKLRLGDGAVTTVCAAPNPRGGTWLDDDTIVFASNGGAGALQRVPAGGGEPRPFTALAAAAGEVNHRWPRAVPGGKAVLFTILTDEQPGEAPRIGIAPFAPGSHRVLAERGFSPGASGDRLLFVRHGALWAAPFDPQRLELRGDATRVSEDIATSPLYLLAFHDIASSGTLAFASALLAPTPRRLVWVDRRGESTPIAVASHDLLSPRLSPDGLRIALQITEPTGVAGIWIYELERQLLSRVTPDGIHQMPHWAPDGASVRFARVGARRTSAILRISSRGGGQPELLLGGDQLLFPASLAYFSDESGRHELYLRPLESPSPRWQLSHEGGAGEIVWSRDGRELFDRVGSWLLSVAIQPGADPAPGVPRRLFDSSFDAGIPGIPNYDVAADGQRFLMVETDTAPRRTPISIVLHFATELDRSAKPDK